MEWTFDGYGDYLVPCTNCANVDGAWDGLPGRELVFNCLTPPLFLPNRGSPELLSEA